MGKPVRFVDPLGNVVPARHRRCGGSVVASIEPGGFVGVCERCGTIRRDDIVSGVTGAPFRRVLDDDRQAATP